MVFSNHCIPKQRKEKDYLHILKANGITSPRKHNNEDHAIVAKRFEDEVNSLMNEKEENFVVDCFSSIVIACVLNQFHGH
jgi:hypothetical protein